MERRPSAAARYSHEPRCPTALHEFLTATAQQRQERDLSFLAEASESMAEVARARDRMPENLDRLVERARTLPTGPPQLT